MAKKAEQNKQENLPQEKDKRKYVNQSLIPAFGLEEALKVPKALLDNFGGKATVPFQIAMALESTQASSYWRKLSGAAVAYGLTDGGYNSTKIGLTELSLKILSPTEEGIDIQAKIDASLRPTLLKQFFEKYNNAKFPKDAIAENVLKLDFNISSEDTSRVLDLIKGNGKFTGILHDTKTGLYVFVDKPANPDFEDSTQKDDPDPKTHNENELPPELIAKLNFNNASAQLHDIPKKDKPKVFISHGKNKKVVEQLREILTFGQFDVTISIEKETTAISVPDKVFSDMRDCDAAVIHVEGEKELLDKEGAVHHVINENVLIEIGAAIALYGKKFILLCEQSVKLPSNLQGLYRCNYEGKELSYDATMKLLKAFNEFRNS